MSEKEAIISCRNFVKCRPIFEIIWPTQSAAPHGMIVATDKKNTTRQNLLRTCSTFSQSLVVSFRRVKIGLYWSVDPKVEISV